jgi:hypothetical protein
MTATPEPEPPEGLGQRGLRTWRQVLAVKGPGIGPGELLLLEETCRVADRLDRLAALLSGEESAWGFIRSYDGDERPAELIVNSALGEARQHATVLRQLVRALAAPATQQVPGGAPAPDPASGEGSDDDGLGDLAAARERRRLAASEGR